MVKTAIAVDRSQLYRVGDTLECQISLSAPDGATIRSARAELIQRQSYAWWQAGQTQNRERYSTLETRLSEAVLLDGGTLPAGFSHVWTPRLVIPDTITAPCEGQHVTIRHLVKFAVDIPADSDASAETGVRIVVPPRIAGEPGEYGVTEDQGFARLKLQLPRLTVAEGDVFQGQVVVEPRREVKVRQVRVRLVGDVTVTAGATRLHQTIVLAETPIAQARVFRQSALTRVDFELSMPTVLCPTHLTAVSRADWRLEAILDRSWASDTRLTQPVQVYNGR